MKLRFCRRGLQKPVTPTAGSGNFWHGRQAITNAFLVRWDTASPHQNPDLGNYLSRAIQSQQTTNFEEVCGISIALESLHQSNRQR